VPAFFFFFVFASVDLLKYKGHRDEIGRFGVLGCNYIPAREEWRKIFTV